MKRWSVVGGIMVMLIGVLALLGSVRAGESVRPAAVAGSWYPGDAGTLADTVDQLLTEAKPVPASEAGPPVRALILPHAGYRFSGATAAAGVRLIQGHPYKRVILLGPAHRVPFRGLSIARVDAYETPLGRIPLDQAAVAELGRSPLVTSVPEAHRREHSLEMELPLLQRALPAGWKLVPLLVGQMNDGDYAAAARLLRPLADSETLVVVSSDFTHYGPGYGYQPFPLDEQTAQRLQALDESAVEPMLKGDREGFLRYVQRTHDTICGRAPIAILLEMLPQQVRGEVVAHATSGALTGSYRQSVSYFAIAFRSEEPLVDTTPGLGGQREAAPVPPSDPPADPPAAKPLSEKDLHLLHRLAVEGIEAAATGAVDDADEELQDLAVSPILKVPSGVFVTLFEDGELRGCKGYILPVKPLYQATYEIGIDSARYDYRFPPVRAEELPGLEVSVSVLTPPRPIRSYQDFQVGTQGIILEKNGHHAVYLPEVATEQGWNREQTLSHLAVKAGLPPDAWKHGAKLSVFTSQKYTAPLEQVLHPDSTKYEDSSSTPHLHK